jgi:hypothetical protein
VTYFKGDTAIRVDMELAKTSSVSRRQIVFTKDTHIHVNLDARKVNLFGPKTRPESSRSVTDPRRLGVVCWFYDSINAIGYEHTFLSPNRDDFRIDTGVEGGEPVLKVCFRKSEGNEELFAEYWLAMEKGWLPLLISHRFGEGELTTVQSLTAKLRTYPTNDVWYPSEVVFSEVRAGKMIIKEIIRVEKAVFGEHIDDDFFTMAGLGLPSGIVTYADGHEMIWNGDRLTSPEREFAQLPQRNSGRRSLFVASSVLAFLATICLWCRRRRLRNEGAGRR